MYQNACCCKLRKTRLKMAKAISGFVIFCKRKFQGRAILWLSNLLEETGPSHFLFCSLQGVVFGLTPLKRARRLPEVQASHAHMEIPHGRKGQIVSSEKQVIFSRSLEQVSSGISLPWTCLHQAWQGEGPPQSAFLKLWSGGVDPEQDRSSASRRLGEEGCEGPAHGVR